MINNKPKYKKVQFSYTSPRTQYLNQYLKVLEPVSSMFIVAGSALSGIIDQRNIKFINDVDLFFFDSTYYNTIKVYFTESLGAEKIFTSKNDCLTTFVFGGVKYQCIYIRSVNNTDSDPVVSILDKFDFRACQMAYYNGWFYFFKNSIRDNKRKILHIHKVTYPITTMKRIAKYKRKGFFCQHAYVVLFNEINTRTFSKEELAYTFD